MNTKKLVLLSLIIPMVIGTQTQAFPGKNALKKAGYAGLAVATAYAGYQIYKNWLLGNNEVQQPVQAQNQPGVKTAQQLLEEKQIQLIDARISARAALKAARPELPVTIVPTSAPKAVTQTEKIEPIFDLKNEYFKVLRTNATNVGSMIIIARKAFDAMAPFLQQHYENTQTLTNFGTTYGQIRACQEVMAGFNIMLKENNYDLSKPEVLRRAEDALKLLYSACASINSSLPLFRTKIAEKAITNWSEWFKGQDAQILEEFDSFKLSFEQRLNQLQPIKDETLTQ